MSEKFIEELEDRRQFVERQDAEARTKNLEQFRNYWLHMTILSSAIVVGVLPLMGEESSLIKSLPLAKTGLALIVFVCAAAIIYLQNVLSREKSLLHDQKEFHENTFSMQGRMIEKARKDGKNEDFIKDIFERSKSAAYFEEQDIVAHHILGKGFVRIRLFINKYFNPFISYGFATGVLLVVLSFV